MTIVEFYDSTPVENMIGCLADRPEKIIFVGDKKALERQRDNFYRFLDEVDNFNTVLEFRGVNRSSLRDLVESLTRIVEENENCCFDLTGGDDLALVAVGIVYARCSERGIHLHRCNVKTGLVYDCSERDETLCGQVPALTVEQNIVLHGGSVVTDEEIPDGTRLWDLSEEFVADLEAMWKICRHNCPLWNAQISMLGLMEGCKQPCEDLMFLCVELEEVERRIQKKYLHLNLGGILREQELAHLIRRVLNEDGYFSLNFKDEQVKKCLTKAGTVLELKTYLSAMQSTGRDGEYIFTDGLTGVLIDWDGSLHSPREREVDTQNEIDVLLMRGLIPVFVSCKNGAVEDDELYKLNTVAERFGSRYAKKIVVATTLGKEGASRRYFMERAHDMGIKVIYGVHEMPEEEFKRRLAEATA